MTVQATLSITIILFLFYLFNNFENGVINKLKKVFDLIFYYNFRNRNLFDTMRYSYRMNQIVEIIRD